MEGSIFFEGADGCADDGYGFAHTVGGLERETVVESLSGAEEFDSEEFFCVLDDLAEFECGGHAHGDVIFFAA